MMLMCDGFDLHQIERVKTTSMEKANTRVIGENEISSVM